MNLAIAILGSAAIAFVVSERLTRLMRFVAPRLGFVDKPGGRKAHKAPTPLGGGVAIWMTTLIVLGAGAAVAAVVPDRLPPELAIHLAGLFEKGPLLGFVLGLATLIMLMGLADDRVGLGWKLRIGVQTALSIALVASGVRITLFPPFDAPLFGSVITVLWIVGLTNSFNFLDNMDGLAAGVGLIAAVLFAVAQLEVGGLFVPIVFFVLAGALGGFLVHNRAPARIFMGDGGSNFLGFMVGTLTVIGTFTRPELGFSPYAVLAPLLVMAVPLYDTTSVVIIRIREGRSPFQADRRHFSHRLVDRGLTPVQAVRTIYLVTLAGGLGTLILPRLDLAGSLVVLSQTLCLVGIIAIFEVAPGPGARPAPSSSPASPPPTSNPTELRDVEAPPEPGPPEDRVEAAADEGV
ncbi:MAG: MraY family glycosyltransferase [Isosphaeraceae bacterium]|nr:MraY family glycosyltransferase [Isosphaeraceae bacterium]